MAILTDFEKLLALAVASPKQMIMPLDKVAPVLGFKSLAIAQIAVKAIDKEGWTEIKTLNCEKSSMILEDSETVVNLTGFKALCLHHSAQSGKKWNERCAKLESALNIEQILGIIENGSASDRANARGLVVNALSEASLLQAQVKSLKVDLEVSKDVIKTLKSQLAYSNKSKVKS